MSRHALTGDLVNHCRTSHTVDGWERSWEGDLPLSGGWRPKTVIGLKDVAECWPLGLRDERRGQLYLRSPFLPAVTVQDVLHLGWWKGGNPWTGAVSAIGNEVYWNQLLAQWETGIRAMLALSLEQVQAEIVLYCLEQR